jgi:hypothetical protein
VLADTVNIVLKYERDMQRAVEVLPRLVDPNRELPGASHAQGHGADHGHGAEHEHGYEHGHRRDEHAHARDDEPDGRTARQAMDRPGRHDDGYYGAPGPGPSRRAETGAGQGSRSFAAFTRRRPG